MYIRQTPKIVTKNVPSYSPDLFAVTPIIVDYSPIDFDLYMMPNSVYICTSANPRGLTRVKTYINYVLVESSLTPRGPRQKIVCSLGDLRPRPKAEWLELAHKLSSALSGQADLLANQAPDPELHELLAKVQSTRPASPSLPTSQPAPAAADLVAVHVDQVRTEESREAGP